jgi:hypothetical protein
MGIGYADCESLPPFAFVHDYLYRVSCPAGVSCEAFNDRCSCECGVGDESVCTAIQSSLSWIYFGEDELGLIPGPGGPYEFICDAPPWQYDPEAYGSGGWVGGSCTFDNEVREGLPAPLQGVIDSLTCDGSSCIIPADTFDAIMLDVGMLLSSAVSLSRSGVELDRCEDVCVEIGLIAGDTIVSVGRKFETSLDPASWLVAKREFEGDGETAIAYKRPDSDRQFVITFVRE